MKKYLSDNTPRYIRIYDNGGETFDRYTVVFTGKYRKRAKEFIYLGMSENPHHPQGFCQHGFAQYLIDRPTYSHLGKPVKYQDLPDDCRISIDNTYESIWK